MEDNPQPKEIDIIDSISDFIRRQINKPVKIFKSGKYVINIRQGVLMGGVMYLVITLVMFSGFFRIF